MEAGHLNQSSDKLIYAYLIWKQKETAEFSWPSFKTQSPLLVIATQN